MQKEKIDAQGSVRKMIKKWWWAIAAVAIVLVGIGVYFLGQNPSARNASEDAGEVINTASVRRGDLRVSITGSGALEAGRTVDLKFTTDGIVDQLNVSLGDAVQAGETLAALTDTISLEAEVASAELAYLEAKADLNELMKNADVSLAEAYQTYVTALSEQESAANKVARLGYSRCSREVNTNYMATIEHAGNRMGESEVGSEQWIAAKSEYDTAMANYTYCIGYTDAEKEEAQAELAVADENLQVAESTYNILKEGSGLNPDTLALAQATLTQAETALAAAREELSGATLVAPMGGEITYLAAGEGEMAGTDTFITISDKSRLFVTVQVDESDMTSFAVGNAAEVVFDALPDEVFQGTVVEVSPQLTSSSGVSLLTGKIDLDQDEISKLGKVPLGLNGTVEVIDRAVSDAILVPVESLRDLGDGKYAVFVMDADGTLKLRVVEIGISDSTYVEITSGLEAGELVSTGLVETVGQ
ncbi:MAG: efflux RND transporter periplasmic adaptor subunit [Anaerolineae bacterium]|nr:efflux RND transporter periplasmic adaptor subunit [Anaerolineae bacterium]